jgi:hypothetical protein
VRAAEMVRWLDRSGRRGAAEAGRRLEPAESRRCTGSPSLSCSRNGRSELSLPVLASNESALVSRSRLVYGLMVHQPVDLPQEATESAARLRCE